MRSLKLSLLVLLLLSAVGRGQGAGDTLGLRMSEVEQAMADAKYDARRDASAGLWLTCGLTTLCVGVSAAYVSHPGPRLDRLEGKSAAYVDAYVASYRSKRHSLQTNYALVGCAISGCAVAGLVGLALAAEGSSADWTCHWDPCSDACEPFETLAEDCAGGIRCLEGSADCTEDCVDADCWSGDSDCGSSSCSGDGCGDGETGDTGCGDSDCGGSSGCESQGCQ